MNKENSPAFSSELLLQLFVQCHILSAFRFNLRGLPSISSNPLSHPSSFLSSLWILREELSSLEALEMKEFRGRRRLLTIVLFV